MYGYNNYLLFYLMYGFYRFYIYNLFRVVNEGKNISRGKLDCFYYFNFFKFKVRFFFRFL